MDGSKLLEWAGMEPDQWQIEALDSNDNLLLLCSRQAGKSLSASALGLVTALTEPNSLILLLSPTLRQSGELFRHKLLPLYDRTGRLVPQTSRTALSLELANGSRIISLPENEEGIRGFSGVRLLVIDEASRVSDSLYYAVRPMLAVSGGKIIGLSTPFGKRGWFWEEWEKGRRWQRIRLTADKCPRISAEFLEEERLSLGPRWFAQEYMCSFEDAIDAIFMQADIDAALANELKPLF